jgi:zinc transporter ZupT
MRLPMTFVPTLLSAIIAFAATVSAGIFAAKYKRNIGIVCAFTAGVLVALVLFDLLPEILTLAPRIHLSLEMPLFTIVLGFLFLFSLERGLFQTLKTYGRNDKTNYKTKFGTVAAMEFCAHGFIEGLAIGISFQFEWSLGLVVAFAVISHDFCDGLSTLTIMLNSSNTMRSSMKMLFFDAIAPVLGATITLFFNLPSYYLVFTMSFLAGSFVYMGAGSLLPEAHRKNRPKVTFIFFVTGFTSIFVLSRLINA